MNKWIGIGRLTAAPELKHTQSGMAVASYRLAVDRQVKKDGQREADFISCVAWDKTAEFASKYLAKGMRIAVEGRLQTRSYEDKDGKKVHVTEIVVERHEFCDSKKEPSNNATQSIDVEPGENFAVVSNDDDLPF